MSTTDSHSNNNAIHAFIAGSKDLINVGVKCDGVWFVEEPSRAPQPQVIKQSPEKRKLLKLFQILGLFPYNFDPSPRTCGLKPMKAKKYLPILFGVFTMIPVLLAICYSFTKRSNPLDFLTKVYQTQLGYVNTFTDHMAANAYLGLTWIIGGVIIYENFCISRKLPELWDFIEAEHKGCDPVSRRFLLWSLR